MFALFEDDFILFVRRPQASLPSAAQPAVMDIRRLRRRLLEIISYFKCESSVDKEYGEKALLKKMKKRIATPL